MGPPNDSSASTLATTATVAPIPSTVRSVPERRTNRLRMLYEIGTSTLYSLSPRASTQRRRLARQAGTMPATSPITTVTSTPKTIVEVDTL